MLVLLTIASCSPKRELVSNTPKTTREAFVYDDKVVIVTETVITKDEYNRLINSRKENNN